MNDYTHYTGNIYIVYINESGFQARGSGGVSAAAASADGLM